MKEIEAIKQALAAGPTPGPWYADNKFGIGPTSTDDDQSFGFVIPCAEVSGENIENNARYIAVCNPAAMQAIIDHIDEQAAEIERLRVALKFYAEGDHFHFDSDAWDTVSDEPQNFWCDEAGTATVEDGTIAKLALAAAMKETL